MILYFSATGNSRYVAEQLAAATGDIRLTDMHYAGAPGQKIIIPAEYEHDVSVRAAKNESIPNAVNH